MKKCLFMLSVGLVLVFSFFVFAGSASAAPTFINIGTGSTGGTFYPVGVILANTFNNELSDEGYKFTAQTSGGTTENLEMLRGKELKLAVCGSVPTANAYNGIDKYENKPIRNIRFVTALWPEAIQLMYREKSGIKTLEDFTDKKIAVGPAAGGGVFYLPIILGAAHGMSFDDFQPQYLGYGDSVQALQNKLIDACYLAAGIPTSAVSQLYAGQVKVGMVEFSDDELARITEEAPYVARVVIPAETYPKQKNELRTIGFKSSLVAEKDQDADMVYSMLEGLYVKQLEEVKKQHGALKTLSLEDAVSGLSGAPLHPGAVKFFTEHGVDVPESLIPPEMK